MVKTIIIIVAMTACLLSLWKAMFKHTANFDKVFFSVLSVVFILIGIVISNTL